jgi:hypothetical protein
MAYYVYPNSAEGIQYHALPISLRVKQLEREAAYLCLVTRMSHLTPILLYTFTVRVAGSKRLYFQEHETQIFSVVGFRWVFWTVSVIRRLNVFVMAF